MTTAEPQFSVGTSLTWAWDRFKDNAGPLVLATLAWAVILGVINYIASMIAFGVFSQDSIGGTIAGNLIVLIITIVPIAAAAAGFLNGAVAIANGQKPDFGQFFQLPRFVPVLIAMIVVALFRFIGEVILSWIPGPWMMSAALMSIWGLIVMLAAMWAYYFAVDGDQDGFPAVQSTVSLFGQRPGPSILVALVNFALALIGAILCGVGLLVAMPVVVLFTLNAFRTLTGKPIAGAPAAYDAPGYPTAYPYGDPAQQYDAPPAPPAFGGHTPQYGTPPAPPAFGDPTQQYGTPPAYGDPTQQYGTPPEEPGDGQSPPRGY